MAKQFVSHAPLCWFISLVLIGIVGFWIKMSIDAENARFNQQLKTSKELSDKILYR
jgi:hypothetical protein